MIDTGETARSEVAAGPSGVWVLNQHGDPPDGLVWLTRAGPRSDRPELPMVNPATDRVGLTVSLPGADLGQETRGLLVAWDTVWVADGQGRLLRVALPVSQAEPVSGVVDVGWPAPAAGSGPPAAGSCCASTRSTAGWTPGSSATTRRPGQRPGLAVAGRHRPSDALLVRLDPGTGQPERVIQLARSAEQYRPKLAAGRRVVAARAGQDLYLVDAATDSIRATVELGNTLGGVAADADAVWVTDPTRGRLLRIDPGSEPPGQRSDRRSSANASARSPSW